MKDSSTVASHDTFSSAFSVSTTAMNQPEGQSVYPKSVGSEATALPTVLIDEEDEIKFANQSLDNIYSASLAGSIHANRRASSGSSNKSNSANNGNRNNAVLPLPSNFNSPAAFTIQSMDNIQQYLSSLQNENSTYISVAKACHFLNQFGTHGSYNATPTSSSSCSSSLASPSPPPTVVQSSILNIERYTSEISHILNILTNTATSHSDRRCRILALQSISIISNATLSKLLFTPHVYSNATRESIHQITKLQDEICNDVIYTIVNTVVLEEDDDGVSSIAMESLGRFIASAENHVSELSKEVYNIQCKMMVKCHHLIPRRGMWDGEGGPYGCGGYANSIQDVDYMLQKSDLQWKVLSYVLGPPRIRKLFIRVSLYQQREHQVRCLNVLNEIMMFVYRTERARRGKSGSKNNAGATNDNDNGNNGSSVDIGKDGFAKRWYEFDSTMLIQEYVETFLIPLLCSCSTSNAGQLRNRNQRHVGEEADIGIVVNALMLCSVVKCKETWYDQLIQLSVQTLQQGLIEPILQQKQQGGGITTNSKKKHWHEQTTQEMKLDKIATLLVALRGIQRMDRVKKLIVISEIISKIPSTHCIPKGPISPALQFQDGSRRMPSRIGYWAEIAFSILLPDGISNHEELMTTSANGTKSTTILSDTNLRVSSKQSSWNAVKYFLASHPIQNIFESKSDANSNTFEVIHPAEEMVYTLCSVACAIGKRISPTIFLIENEHGNNVNDDSSHVMIDVQSQSSIQDNLDGLSSSSFWIQLEYESWLHASLEILNSFLPCFGWNSSLSNSCKNEGNRKIIEEATSFTFACQRSFIELLKVVLFTSGMLGTTSSVFLHFCCSIPSIPDDEKEESVKPFLQSTITIENELKAVLDKILKLLQTTSQAENELSRRQRISLLTLLSDTWVQQSKGIMSSNGGLQLDQKEIAGPVDVDEDVANINEQQARQLLSQLATEISMLLNEEKKGCNTADKSSSDSGTLEEGEAQRYLLTCIASVESIGYTSQLLVNHFSESKTNAENEESARHIVSVCTVVLKGQGKVEIDDSETDVIEVGTNCEEDSVSTASQNNLSNPESGPRSPLKSRVTSFTKECSNAAKRLQNFVNYYDNEFDFDKKDHQLIDFNCLCPLFKCANYGLSKECLVNDLWILGDQMPLIQISNDTDDNLFGESPTRISQEGLLNMQKIFTEEDYYLGYFLHLYRQLLSQMVEEAIESSPLHFLKDPVPVINVTSSKAFPYKKLDPLRLSTPPLPKERFPSGRMMNEEKSSFSNNVTAISSGSDPLAVTLSYSVRQLPRFDGDVEWGLVVTIVVYNVTAVPISNGVRMDATISLGEKLTDSNESVLLNNAIMTETSVFKNELEPGGHFIWEFVLDSWPLGADICVTTTLRGLEVEASNLERLNTNDFNEEKEISDDQFEDGDKMERGNNEGEETIDVIFPGTPVSISSMIILQPSPLVFYHDRLGDQNAFQFLWFSMSHCLPGIEIVPTVPRTGNKKTHSYHNACRDLASSSRLNVFCTDDKETKQVSAWAFLTWCGKHILIISDSNISSNVSKINLLIRGDDQEILNSCIQSQKQMFISDLTDGNWSLV